MSNLYFPSLPGLTWDIKREIETASITYETASFMECRIQTAANQRIRWTLKYNYLRTYPNPAASPAANYAELQSLEGFFGQMGGQYQNFLYTDPNDLYVLQQPIGTGDGSTAAFQLQRTRGGWVQQVFDPNPAWIPAFDGQPAGQYSVFLGSSTPVNPSLYTISSGPNGGLLTFTGGAPSTGELITANIGYDWRCRFDDAKLDVDGIMNQLFSQDGITFHTTRQ